MSKKGTKYGYSNDPEGFHALTILGVSACADGLDEPQPNAEEQVAEQSSAPLTLAEVDIEGRKAKFIEFDEETFYVETLTRGVPDPLRQEAVRGLNLAELYEYWSGKPAPSRLLALVNKAAARAPEGDLAQIASALTSAEFQEQECSPSAHCLLNEEGTWEHEVRARYLLFSVNAVQGDVSVQVRRRDVIGGWGTIYLQDVVEGTLLSQQGATSGALNKRPLKLKVFNADGNRWHLAARWTP